jgi:hypothetical protein
MKICQPQLLLIIKRKLTALKGLLGTAARIVSLEEMEQTIRKRSGQK